MDWDRPQAAIVFTTGHTLSNPCGVSVFGKYVYVANSGGNSVVVFTTEGDCVATLGRCKGSAQGNFNCPMGVFVDEDGYVYVCDTGNNRVQVF